MMVGMEESPDLNWLGVSAFVRQHTHDVRNHLNGLDLEAALLAELVTDPEAKESVTRIRRQIRETAAAMRTLSAKFSDSKLALIPIAARDLVEIWKEQHATVEGAPEVVWNDRLGEEKVSVDPESIAAIFKELLCNATAFRSQAPLSASALVNERNAIFALGELKDGELDPSNWGRVPFHTTRRGGYGLGLWSMSRKILANGGEIERSFDPARRELVTTLRFPVL